LLVESARLVLLVGRDDLVVGGVVGLGELLEVGGTGVGVGAGVRRGRTGGGRGGGETLLLQPGTATLLDTLLDTALRASRQPRPDRERARREGRDGKKADEP
jgi:hypothetical protein